MAQITIKDLEKSMTPMEIKVAYTLTENEFCPKEERRTVQAIADELEISRQAVYQHKNKPKVIRLIGMLSDRHLDAFKVKVDHALTRLIYDGTERLPSVKAIELYYKLKGLMIDRSITGTNEADVAPRISDEELTAELANMNKLLNGGN